ncbi:hypothetical protein [Halosegnis marinus]|uniref:Uncharacterized protein n=1 Tax=Halosegnis marinus TaxID=3034023 RepID=A0ABD5ZLK4_9EURY|nr:hypothetical protein [Halosegnis sp. DT85]
MSNSTTGSSEFGADTNPVVRAVQLRWKHGAIAFVLGAATYALYGLEQGWSIDAAVFGVTTLGIILYSAVTYRRDAA